MYDELLTSLREHYEWAIGNEWETPITLSDDLGKAIEAIEELSAKYEKALHDLVKLAEPRWITVEKKLPEENGFYLCCYEAKCKGGVAMDDGLSILQYLDQKWHLNEMYIVTHWMKLPELP